MKFKKIITWAFWGLILFMILNYFYITYGIKWNTGYINGKVIRVEMKGKSQHPYAYFSYEVNGIKYNGKCGGSYLVGDDCLVVYDTRDPAYSMIATYPYPILDSLGNLNKIDTDAVDFDVWNYSGNNLSN